MKRYLCPAILLAVFFLAGRFWSEVGVHAAGGGAAIQNGDVNGDGSRDVSDAIALLSWLFLGGPAPPACGDAGSGLTPDQLEALSHISMVTLPDGQGGAVRTIRISGVNVQIVNGAGSTATANGAGNLIVGYQELQTDAGAVNDRRGSHNVVAGSQNNYKVSAFGGLVIGITNTIDGSFSSVSGGTKNRAAGDNSSVSGGILNHASGPGCAVSGGEGNEAHGPSSIVSGGVMNSAFGRNSSVNGGFGNYAGGERSTMSGGANNSTQGDYSFIGGGGGVNFQDGNHAEGPFSALVGGKANQAGDSEWDQYSTVVGGGYNRATGNFATVSGGDGNTASGEVANVSGGQNNTASGERACVAGGSGNQASAKYATVRGGCTTAVTTTCGAAP